MKKFLTFILVLAAVLSVSSIALAADVNATYDPSLSAEVNGKNLWTTIKGASDGDTIKVPAGTYELTDGETSRIAGKSVTLVGEGEGVTTLKGEKYGLVIQNTAGKHVDFTIKNMTIESVHSWGHSIYVKGDTAVNLENVTLTNPGTTVILIESINCVEGVGGNVFEDNITASVNAKGVTIDSGDTVEMETKPNSGISDLAAKGMNTRAEFNYSSDCTNITDDICKSRSSNLGFGNVFVNGNCINPAVAQIKDTKYTSLQAAINAAQGMTGDVTIKLLADIAESVAIKQKEGLNLTIEGNENFTMKPAAGKQYIIAIDGTGRSAGSDTLLIKDVVFDFDGTAGAAICAGRNGAYGTPALTGTYNYAHNVTIEGCDFDLATGIVAVNVWQGFDINISECVVNGGHSLIQSQNCNGVTIENTQVYGASEGGVNLDNSTGVTVSGCTFECGDYGVRGGGANDADGDVTIKGTSIKAKYPIIMRYQTTDDAYTLDIKDEGNALTPDWDNTTEPTYSEEAPIYVTKEKMGGYDNENLKQVGGIVAWNKDTNTYYTGWRAAIADAKPGETVYPVENGNINEDGAETIPEPTKPSGSGISVTYNGGNSFSTSNPTVPTGVEIDGVPVTFNGTGSNFSVGCISSDAKWVTVRWNSTSVTTNFTPDGLVECTTVSIPKTGDMSIWAAVAAFFGF